MEINGVGRLSVLLISFPCVSFKTLWNELKLNCCMSYAVRLFDLTIFVRVYICAAPLFEIRHPSVIHYRSGVHERANKKDRHIDMALASPVVLCGDVMIEFFNKPRMMKKV